MSLDPPTYLASLQSNIRQRPIPWDGAVRAGTLTDEQYAKIRAVDKAKRPEQRKEIVEADVDGYRLLFVGGDGKPSVLESAGKHANVIQYILVLLADLLDGKSVAHRVCLLSFCTVLARNTATPVWSIKAASCLPLLDLSLELTRPSTPSCPVPSQSHLQEHRSVPTFLTAASQQHYRRSDPPAYFPRPDEPHGPRPR